jgi:Arc/MetJ family transcription regulator
MHRTTIDIDIAAYEQARKRLGTRGYKDTVNAALRQVGREEALARAAERIRENRFRAPDPEELAELRQRRPRLVSR